MKILPLLKILTIAIAVTLSISSCTREENDSRKIASNLVIVADNEQGSYFMTKLLGEVRSAFPNIHITYLQSKLFDVTEGSFLLKTAVESFPEGTVVAGILEPGGGSRKIVFQANSRLVFAPDNTLSTRIFNDFSGTECYFVENSSVLGGQQASELALEEFYARGICSLISGIDVSKFGSLCSNPNTFAVQNPVMQGDSILGEILFADTFGNCITNIPESLIVNIPLGTTLSLNSGTTALAMKLGTTYSSVPVGDNVCFINSSNLLEISINYGNFSSTYNLFAGSHISIKP